MTSIKQNIFISLTAIALSFCVSMGFVESAYATPEGVIIVNKEMVANGTDQYVGTLFYQCEENEEPWYLLKKDGAKGKWQHEMPEILTAGNYTLNWMIVDKTTGQTKAYKDADGNIVDYYNGYHTLVVYPEPEPEIVAAPSPTLTFMSTSATELSDSEAEVEEVEENVLPTSSVEQNSELQENSNEGDEPQEANVQIEDNAIEEEVEENLSEVEETSNTDNAAAPLEIPATAGTLMAGCAALFALKGF